MSDIDAEDQIVWENSVDGGVWRCWVVRTDNYTGRLKCENVASGKQILNEEVGLAYQAIFGPDVDDVSRWQDMVIGAIDAQEVNDG